MLETLKRCGECDVSGLAAKFGISGVAVRQHLGILERDGFVTYRQERRPVGRPVRLYSLTPTAELQHFPETSGPVALDLLTHVEKLLGAEAIESALAKRTEDLVRRYGEQIRGARSWKQKLELLAAIRDAEGYLCSVEPAAASKARGGVRLVHHHCPIAAVVEQYPQVCSHELKLFKRVLGERELRRTEHIRGGQHVCSYELPAKRAARRPGRRGS